MADPGPEPLHFTDYDTRLAAYAVIVDEQDRILLTWFNGGPRGARPGWTLPGGGVDFAEQLEEAVVREVREEAGYDVVVGRPVSTHSFVGERGATTGRPYKSARVLFEAAIVGGTLGTLEVGGTTDFAAWIPLTDLDDPDEPYRSDVVDLAVSAHRARRARTHPDG